MYGTIHARDRNRANLLVKELQRIEDAIFVIRKMNEDEMVHKLTKLRTKIRRELEQLSC